MLANAELVEKINGGKLCGRRWPGIPDNPDNVERLIIKCLLQSIYKEGDRDPQIEDNEMDESGDSNTDDVTIFEIIA